MLKRFFSRPSRNAQVLVVARIERSVFEKFKADLGGARNTFVTKDTTAIQAGFSMGVAHVLNALESGIVIEASTRQ